MGEPRFPGSNRVRQLEHAMAILDLFHPPERGELSLSSIAEELGLSEQYANKLLRHLEAADIVVRSATSGAWRLGIRLAQLGGYALSTLRPWEEFRPPLAALQGATGMGGLIAVLSGGRAIHIDHFRGPERALGRAFPAHATSLGKAILAELPEEDRNAALAEMVLAPWTERTIVNREALLADLALAAKRGYAVEDAEFHDARRSVGAAVRDQTGAVVAAVGVGNTLSRLPMDAVEEVAAAVVEAAGEVSRRLGAGMLPDLPSWRPVVEVQAVMEPPLEIRSAGASEDPRKPRRRRPRTKKSPST